MLSEASVHGPVHTQHKEVTRKPQVTCVSLSYPSCQRRFSQVYKKAPHFTPTSCFKGILISRINNAVVIYFTCEHNTSAPGYGTGAARLAQALCQEQVTAMAAFPSGKGKVGQEPA